MNKKYIGLVTALSLASVFAATTGVVLPSGAGNYSAWTPSTGATHFTLVDESSCNGTTDYVSTTVNGNRDSFSTSVSAVPNGAVITSISLTPCASKSANSGTANLSVFYRLNGVNSADSATYILSGTKPVNLSATNFTGLSITKNASTTLESGAILVSGTTGARLSRLATTITYVVTPSAPNAMNSIVATTSPLKVTASWGAAGPDVTGFSLEKSTDGVNFTVATTTGNVFSYSDFAVSSGATYYYKVRAFNTAGYSGYSSTTIAVVP